MVYFYHTNLLLFTIPIYYFTWVLYCILIWHGQYEIACLISSSVGTSLGPFCCVDSAWRTAWQYHLPKWPPWVARSAWDASHFTGWINSNLCQLWCRLQRTLSSKLNSSLFWVGIENETCNANVLTFFMFLFYFRLFFT